MKIKNIERLEGKKPRSTRKTNTTILAIVRSGENILNPGGKVALQENDTLVITGTHLAVDNAISYLDKNGNVIGIDIDRASKKLDLKSLETKSLPTINLKVA